MAEPFIGQLMCVGFNFAPRGWSFCNGSILPIAQNTALFSLFGTFYGGNGTTTFGLPDLRGRVPVGMGQGPGLSLYSIGQVGGVENVTLTTDQMPAHGHTVSCNSGDASDQSPVATFPSAGGAYNSAANNSMNANMIGPAGKSQPHTNLQPFLALNWIVALEGIFPPRS